MKHLYYVRLIGGGVGQLVNTDSTNPRGKYAILVKGSKSNDPEYFKEWSARITKEEYDADNSHELKPAKQPAKRGSKKNV